MSKALRRCDRCFKEGNAKEFYSAVFRDLEVITDKTPKDQSPGTVVYGEARPDLCQDCRKVLAQVHTAFLSGGDFTMEAIGSSFDEVEVRKLKLGED